MKKIIPYKKASYFLSILDTKKPLPQNVEEALIYFDKDNTLICFTKQNIL